jgi:prepilin-type N-terminal cleavage/methylation domain-containing protein
MAKISSTVAVKNSTPLSQGAFSLLELLIVILIISVAYMLAFASMKEEAKSKKPLHIDSLRTTLLSGDLNHTDGEFFCIDHSKSCYVYKNGTTTRYKGKLALGELEVYYVDEEQRLTKVEYGRHDGHRLSLRLQSYHNGSSKPLIIKNQEGIYYLPSFFGMTQKVDSLDSAKEMWLANRDILKDSSQYY